jgi:hypothetical protein
VRKILNKINSALEDVQEELTCPKENLLAKAKN